MKKKILILSVLILSIVIGFVVYAKYFSNASDTKNIFKDEDSIQYMSKVDAENFYIYKDNTWQKEFIMGVNMGAAKPGYFPGEFGITKEDYLRWFKYISDMNSNTIRIYTILNPEFYDAFYEYNESAVNTLYLIQGVWINESDIAKYKDAYNPQIESNFKEEIETTIDVLHGNKIIKKVPGNACGIYEKDVSKYVLGYVLGIEWDPAFVTITNDNNKDNVNYDGKYLYSKDASPFENFLCSKGDECIEYETENYKIQRPVSFTNWVTTDMLSHPNEPLVEEDQVCVNVENIKSKDTFKAGLFASYHIYPYYPDSMNYQKEYSNFKDNNGNIDTYRAYLKDLKKEHSIPVLVAEFGIPASRGKAHENINTGFNQGNVSEKDQGEMDAAMLKDIYEEGYAGGIVFAFQDEWFKRAWNTMGLDIADRRAYWNNTQTNEQHFGLLSFDSGKKESTCYVDGDINDWDGTSAVSTNNGTELYVKSDETYLYFMVKSSNFDFAKDNLFIPIDTIQNQGNLSYNGLNFNKDADFIVSINGTDKSQILVDPYYDSFQYLYGNQLSIITQDKDYDIKNSDKFNPIYLPLNIELELPQDKVKIPFSKYETGKLLYGDGNPNNENYNSLADFYVKDNVVEVRIPWQLINVMDPSTKMIMNDLQIDGIRPIKTDGINVGSSISSDTNADQNIEMNLYNWDTWENPIYHERLKESYYILKDAFSQYK
ncbi:family 2 glycosyl transferase [Clostridium vincentii]|uniref:Family 2 glycosyl transferase n=1 Tax=Clostridium vincentii TaxID=52704 RepID=A0A2T0BCZ8_9CLOT|nr:family 2 glycosyl transferase [Clostridium vincentii]PRR81687.1 hypothetical protein CLVI_22960 [Clostridium vincentii]